MEGNQELVIPKGKNDGGSLKSNCKHNPQLHECTSNGQFRGTKDIISQFVVSRYHNGNFYFDRPIEIFGDMIYRISGLFNKGESVPMSSNLILVEILTRTPIANNSHGLIINQIQYTTPKIVEKNISTSMTSTRRGYDSKLNMLEAVVNIAQKGKIYWWEEHLAGTIKHTCAKYKEDGTPIKFPSLVI